MKYSERVVKREEIMNKVWTDVVVESRTLDVHIRSLRKKLSCDCIKTIKGIGFRFSC